MTAAIPTDNTLPRPDDDGQVANGMVARLRLSIGGAVQGVGFRPFIYRLALELGLHGWVRNSAIGVTIEVEGSEAALRTMRRRIEEEPPAGSHLGSVEAVWLDAVGYESFTIVESEAGAGKQAWIRPDVATCDACVTEIFDPSNRRHGYAFTNCTFCGPRYSIMESTPYDRARTTMKRFVMCAECRAEYENPGNRRFHAQPNACPRCGPQLAFWDVDGRETAVCSEALAAAVDMVRSGRVLALKGLGGFQLVADAGSEDAVRRLRLRKRREEKPLALVFAGLSTVEQACVVTPAEAALLRAPEAPIVLLRKRGRGGEVRLAESVAPGNPWLGVMLPCTPLHHLLLAAVGGPVIATSGNVSDEPICVDEAEALDRLRTIADGYLVHDRPIVRQVDDSIVRIVAGREMVLRRARGYAPLPVQVKAASAGVRPVLAVGGQLKNTVALGTATGIVLSQHIGDLETVPARNAFGRICGDLPRLFEIVPERVMTDLHPDYASTREAGRMGLPCHGVQHHHAHLLACMAENELDGPVLGIVWDGSGWGEDRTIWGGEALLANGRDYRRFAALRLFRLPGGERAIREPRRSALGVLWELFGSAALDMKDLAPVSSFDRVELGVLGTALARGLNSPLTSSMGRLFDAVAALSGLRQRLTFEGQAAMELEWAVQEESADPYPAGLSPAYGRTDQVPERSAGETTLRHRPRWWIDWGPLIRGVIDDVRGSVDPGRISSRLHVCLAVLVTELAERAGLERVVLTGGCFQNHVLLAGSIARLRAAGHRVYWPQRVPANDGGLAMGQAVAGLMGQEQGTGDDGQEWVGGGWRCNLDR